MMVADIVRVDVAESEVVAGVRRLHAQVSSSATVPGADDIAGIVAGPTTVLFVARERDEARCIVGMLTLVMFLIPSGLRAWIEDVAVDEAALRTAKNARITFRHLLTMSYGQRWDESRSWK